MAISQQLHQAILTTLKLSPTTLSRRAVALAREHGPMSGDEARWVLAHEGGVPLKKYGLTQEQLDRVRELRLAVGARAARSEAAPLRERQSPSRDVVRVEKAGPSQLSPSQLFESREFHDRVKKSSQKLFTGRHFTEAIRKAFQSVNNRVKRLSGLNDDGASLMGKAFSDNAPPLRMTDMANTSEKDEHAGVRFLMMGGVLGLRNPRTHEDAWEPDKDVGAALEALALASLLHRFLDRCEFYAAAGHG